MKALARELHLFFNALTFFSRIPAPRWVCFSEDRLNRSCRYFPAVGLVVGLLCALLLGLLQLWLPLPVALLLSIAFGVLLTGGFHEDGLADTCDGFGGGWTREQILHIMKDSRLGSYGALGLMLVMGLKFAALLNIDNAIAALILGHTLSRLVAASLIYTDHYVQQERLSKSRPLANRMSGKELLIATLPVLLCVPLLPAASWWPILISQLALRYALSRLFRNRLGGYTGDCLGATQQLSELMLYLTLCMQWPQ